MSVGIFTTLRSRAQVVIEQQPFPQAVAIIAAEIASATYFRKPDEMVATSEPWKRQACEMLARLIGDEARRIQGATKAHG